MGRIGTQFCGVEWRKETPCLEPRPANADSRQCVSSTRSGSETVPQNPHFPGEERALSEGLSHQLVSAEVGDTLPGVSSTRPFTRIAHRRSHFESCDFFHPGDMETIHLLGCLVGFAPED